MSHDQKPGKMRVVGSAQAARRRTDPAAPAAAPAAVAANDAVRVPTVAPPRWSSVLIAMLYLIGSGLGGAAMALMSRS